MRRILLSQDMVNIDHKSNGLLLASYDTLSFQPDRRFNRCVISQSDSVYYRQPNGTLNRIVGYLPLSPHVSLEKYKFNSSIENNLTFSSFAPSSYFIHLWVKSHFACVTLSNPELIISIGKHYQFSYFFQFDVWIFIIILVLLHPAVELCDKRVFKKMITTYLHPYKILSICHRLL